jgi:SpoVK/Ycf46/Vps4 family AAA+-type ATPase
MLTLKTSASSRLQRFPTNTLGLFDRQRHPRSQPPAIGSLWPHWRIRYYKSHDEQRTGITFSGLLNGLDGITTQENFICFITTNYKCNLDSALLRPGRIDYIMKFEYANKEQVFDIFRMYTNSDNNKHLADKFYEALCALNIKVTTCLIQQYLMKYLDQPDLAIKNIHEMKEMYQSCTINKEADETGLFS